MPWDRTRTAEGNSASAALRRGARSTLGNGVLHALSGNGFDGFPRLGFEFLLLG